MSTDHNQQLNAFVLLLEKEPQLFSSEYRQKLLELIERLPDDVETLSIEIITSCKQEQEIFTVYKNLLKEIAKMKGKMKGTEKDRIPGTNFGNIPKPNQQINKETLKNAIQQSVKNPSAKP
ncbi:hypothetical protein [Planktothrix agardhii]|jgi:hypothetical protein|uniref:hypothetical protein n=1 Tax=Planktothrix agardhii TaxID=1160 RepID=UPI001D0A0A4B|nr:hypothetical protein [Planktothrix agardhii]MCB8750372.1 hypothetical protein [Planktothrix agardhii 1810]MCF3609514.1 hypothetical protein [Planktothrix agardhii 1033]